MLEARSLQSLVAAYNTFPPVPNSHLPPSDITLPEPLCSFCFFSTPWGRGYHLFRGGGECQPVATVEKLVLKGDMSGARGGETKTGSMMAEDAMSVEGGSRKIEPEIVRMLVGLVVATGVIGALVLLS